MRPITRDEALTGAAATSAERRAMESRERLKRIVKVFGRKRRSSGRGGGLRTLAGRGAGWGERRGAGGGVAIADAEARALAHITGRAGGTWAGRSGACMHCQCHCHRAPTADIKIAAGPRATLAPHQLTVRGTVLPARGTSGPIFSCLLQERPPLTYRAALPRLRTTRPLRILNAPANLAACHAKTSSCGLL